MTLILIVGLMLLGGAAFICARSVFAANDQRRDGVELARNYVQQDANGGGHPFWVRPSGDFEHSSSRLH